MPDDDCLSVSDINMKIIFLPLLTQQIHLFFFSFPTHTFIYCTSNRFFFSDLLISREQCDDDLFRSRKKIKLN